LSAPRKSTMLKTTGQFIRVEYPDGTAGQGRRKPGFDQGIPVALPLVVIPSGKGFINDSRHSRTRCAGYASWIH
jgi:hypothetical protein